MLLASLTVTTVAQAFPPDQLPILISLCFIYGEMRRRPIPASSPSSLTSTKPAFFYVPWAPRFGAIKGTKELIRELFAEHLLRGKRYIIRPEMQIGKIWQWVKVSARTKTRESGF